MLSTYSVDLKKAFDSVPHQRLLGKIKSYGIEGNTFKWLSSFLHNHLQRVVLNGVSSQWVKVKTTRFSFRTIKTCFMH